MKAIEAVIMELALRYPCPRDDDPDRYAQRLSLLARDCSSLNPGLLRKACDLVATRSRYLPTAAELHEAVNEVRQAEARLAIESGEGQQKRRIAAFDRHVYMLSMRRASAPESDEPKFDRLLEEEKKTYRDIYGEPPPRSRYDWTAQ
jgi:hypothetical protein